MAKPDETVFRSPLHKPLNLLTEEDISQLTREDCRKFLREKGMRRPSWNKSQAIEQVISLKTLLEPRMDSDSNAGFRPRSAPVVLREKENVADLQVPVSVKDSPRTDSLVEVLYQRVREPVLDINNANTATARNLNAINAPVGQMTIFYRGKVNVFDSMPVDKALAILKLAASHGNVRRDSPPVGTVRTQPFTCTTPIRLGVAFPAAVSPAMHNVIPETSQHYIEEVPPNRDIEPDGPMSRKASVQRYLEKRKDRGKFKKKGKMGSSCSLEMYVNPHQMNPNESQPSPRPPLTPTRCGSVENQQNNVVFPIDLNQNDVQDT